MQRADAHTPEVHTRARQNTSSSGGTLPDPSLTAFAIVEHAPVFAGKSGRGALVITMDQTELKADFLRTYDTYANDIYRFCSVKVTNRELAQDLTQEVFMRYWQTIREGEKMKNERAYLYTLARNLIIDWYRKKKESSLDVLTEQGIDFGNDDHKKIERSAEMNEVLRVIDQLDEDSREALILRFVDGFTPKEIAAMSGESANAVSVRINRAIKKVQGLIHAV
ncbi:MAG TPA: sigma-70 family RNA polymerase sigma factor [Candidatus Paceibacterota bacterium]|nr:sigma-70 family RNA polymerase sigma factor [Candidatus Paceibacterota bacterium]